LGLQLELGWEMELDLVLDLALGLDWGLAKHWELELVKDAGQRRMYRSARPSRHNLS